MAKGFDDRYDVVLTSTDLTSSLVAAAVSRIGKKVLHLDACDHYGQEWSALKLFDILASPNLLLSFKHNESAIDKEELPLSEPSVLQFETNPTISNIHLSTEVFDDAKMCHQFFKDFCRKEPNLEETEQFLQLFSQLKLCKSTQEAKDVLNKIKEISPLNSLDNSFYLDLTPRLILLSGKMVDILIRSDVTRYLQYEKIARILTPLLKQNDNSPNDSTLKLIEVPCTRNEVFKSTNLTLIEKRLLMKFLEFVSNYKKTPEAFSQYENTQFEQCLKEQRLTDNLRDLLVNSVLMDSPQIPTKEALEKIGRFMFAISVNKICRPYVISKFGTDDLVQAFCRYSAIYGGTYCLNTQVSSVKVNEENKCKSVIIDIQQDQPIETDFIVTNCRLKNTGASSKKKSISRAIICSRQSICANNENIDDSNTTNTSLLYLPTSLTGTKKPVFVFETDKCTNACPKGLFIQYIWCDGNENSTALMDLKPVVDLLHKTPSNSVSISDSSNANSTEIHSEPVEDSSNENVIPTELPNQIWSLYFTQSYDVPTYEHSVPQNLFFVTPPINELNFDFVVQEAQSIFNKMYPEEEFFPKTEEPTEETVDMETDDTENESKETNDETKAESNVEENVDC